MSQKPSIANPEEDIELAVRSDGLASAQCSVTESEDNSLKDIAEYGLENNSINAKDTDGTTPLHKAVMEGNLTAIQYLCSRKGIEINARDNEGCTPLYEAAGTGKLEVVPESLGPTPICVGLSATLRLLISQCPL